MIMSLLGVYLLTKGDGINDISEGKLEGIVMILLAGLTEALIYFVVRRLKTSNPWNHLFMSYFVGVFVMFSLVYDRFG